MTRTETLEAFNYRMKNRDPFYFLKIGDDCVFCMRGACGANAEHHQYGPDLGEHLHEAKEYLKNKDNVFIAEWNQPDMVYFDALLSHEDQFLTEDLKEFYKLLKDDPRPKYYFARERMREAAKVFNMEFIPVPYPNSYGYLGQVKVQVRNIARPGIIILFSCGMLSKVMIYEAYKMCQDMTVLDMGSAFDPMFVGDTRSNEAGQHFKVKQFFKDVLQN
jgi:hypothetical protein